MRYAITSLLALGACSSVEPEPMLGDGATGARLSVDYLGDTDVVGFHFEIERVACEEGEEYEPEFIEANVDFLDGVFPGMIELIGQTLDPDSRHLAADFFLTLEPGCYDVQATPVSDYDGDEWKASNDCSTATAEDIVVVASLTTEIALLSQCEGDPLGALDVFVTLNHPPVLDVTIDEKFNYECEPVEVCATVYDVDDDPIEVVFENLSDIDAYYVDAREPELIGFEEGHRIWEACATIVTQYVTSYDFIVTTYDLAADGVRFDDIVDDGSSASLTFPIHTSWAEEPMCWDGDEAIALADIERWPGCAYTDAETYYCSGAYDIDDVIVDAVCDGSTLLEDVLYPEC